MKVAVEIALVLTGLDLGFIIVSGGVSAFGPVGIGGFTLRLVMALVFLVIKYVLARAPEKASLYAYIGLLLILLPLLHSRGYRLRGDGLWYYSYAHSVAFDRDMDLTNQYQRLGIGHFRGPAFEFRFESVGERGRVGTARAGAGDEGGMYLAEGGVKLHQVLLEPPEI